jgi:hypothetical protein
LTRIRAAKPAEKPYKLFDERGLFLLVTPAGGRLWRLRYRIAGVEKLLALGAYPDVPLKRAREKRDEARKLVADGIDPSARRQAERSAAANTFKAVTDEWLVTKEQSLTTATGSAITTCSTGGWLALQIADASAPGQEAFCSMLKIGIARASDKGGTSRRQNSTCMRKAKMETGPRSRL